MAFADTECAKVEAAAAAGRGGMLALYDKGCYDAALQRANALIEAAGSGDARTRAVLLNDAAAISEKLGRYAEANEFYAQAVGLLRSGPDAALGGTLAGNRAVLLYRVGAYDEALKSYTEAIAILETASGADPSALSAAVGGLGLVEQTLGRYQDAAIHLKRALELDEKLRGKVHADVATDLSNLGDLYRALGDFDHALPTYRRAYEIRRKVLPPDHADTTNSLSKLAYAHENLGQNEVALKLYEEALAMRQRVLPAGHPFIASAQSSIGDILRRGGQFDAARPWYDQALAIRRAALPPGHADIADTLHNLGWLLQLKGDFAAAEAHFREALAIREQALGAGHARTADTMARLASVVAARGDSTQALALSLRAFAIARAAGVPQVEFESGVLLATRYHAAGRPEQAVFVGKQAINAMQRIRGQSRTLDPALQRSLMQENGGAYRELASWLVDLGRLAEAEQVLTMLKEVELADLVQRSDVQRTQAEFVGAEKSAAQQGDALVATGVAEASELAALQRRQRAGEKLDEAAQQRLQALKQRQLQWQIDFEKWVSALKFVSDATELRAEVLHRGSDLQTLVRPDPGAVGVSYVVGEQRLAIVVSTGRGSFGREVAIGRVELNRRVAALRQAIEARADVLPAAQALHQVLVAPIAADLAAAKATTLVLALTESLRYLPFAALHDGKQFLVERYALVHWLQAGGTPSGGPAGEWQVAGLGAARGASGFKPLPAVPGELGRIVRDARHPDGTLPGEVLLDGEFDRGGLEDALSGRFNVVHIASHFDFRPGDAERSVLLLGDGNTLSLRELAALDYLNVQLLTLSACNTASGGGTNENGAEVEGLAAAVRRQGARSVLASLWPVADASTAALMQRFYSARAEGRGNALRTAQLAILQGAAVAADESERGAKLAGGGTMKAVGIDPARPWAHPYFWAPFVLSGDWR
ncbi:CHAT domain-containing tetratricopeptide repeat protein [Niveibacterium umoris]|uniref:CHAT domain-containing tetratricopeptide repeat protein n=1 Tax=Niveibacterium umoris TaxID=1193620 RepID=UPI001C849657